MVRSELYKECVCLMTEHNIADSEFDTLCIFQDMLGEKQPLFKPNEMVSEENEAKIRRLVSQRCKGMPLQYLLGSWEFWGLPIKVGEGVLIPRPDTETLVEDVISVTANTGNKSPKIADLCSGSGCIAIALKKELPASEIYAVELSVAALSYLRQNAELNNADIHIVEGDVLSGNLTKKLRDFDIIVSNPPYLTSEDMAELQTEVAQEPKTALYGGTDGLDYYRRMTPIWRNALKPKGFLCYEFGMGQENAIGGILSENGFKNIKFSRDAGGIIRTVTAEKTEE